MNSIRMDCNVTTVTVPDAVTNNNNVKTGSCGFPLTFAVTQISTVTETQMQIHVRPLW